MTGYETFLTYQGVKLHFTTESFDYFKYNRTYRCSVEKFDSRRDKYSFHKLAKRFGTKEELEFFLASIFLLHQKCWVGELNSELMYHEYMVRRKIVEALEYSTIKDLQNISVRNEEDFRRALAVTDSYPGIFQCLLQKEINPETLVVIDSLTNCLDVWSSQITDTIIFPSWKRRLRRYAPFMSIDRKKLSYEVKQYLRSYV